VSASTTDTNCRSGSCGIDRGRRPAVAAGLMRQLLEQRRGVLPHEQGDDHDHDREHAPSRGHPFDRDSAAILDVSAFATA
jgi:hypothetical protein